MTTTVQNQLPAKDSNRQMTPAGDNGTRCWINYDATDGRMIGKECLNLEIKACRDMISSLLKCALYASGQSDFVMPEIKKILDGQNSFEYLMETLEDAP